MVPVLELEVRSGEVEFIVALGKLYDTRVELGLPLAGGLRVSGEIMGCFWVGGAGLYLSCGRDV